MNIAGQINEVNDLYAELNEADNISAELDAIPGVSEKWIANAVEAYMAENPVIEADPTVPSWAKNPTKPSYTAEDVGALSADSLPAAVNEALAQAKASGEFDGKDGKDGYTPQKGIDYFDGYTPVKGVDYFDGKDGSNGKDGVSPTVTIDNNEGGYNLIITDKNGTQGCLVMNGVDGKTPVKGEDYYTEADKTEMVNDVLAALPTWTGGSY